MADVVIFGIRDFASLAHFYLKNDSPHRVVAFTVHSQYLPDDPIFEGLPVVAFEELPAHFPPDFFSCFAPMSPHNMNKDRQLIYGQLKEQRYDLISYVSSRATTFPDQHVGDNCFILEDNTIQPFAVIGDNVVLWSGNHIGHHSTIGSHSFVTSHVVISGHCSIGESCFFGVNATVRDQLNIGQGSFIAMAASVTADTDEWSVYKGNPARKSKVASFDMWKR